MSSGGISPLPTVPGGTWSSWSVRKRAAYVAIFVLNVTGQATQNICLPLALSSGADMAVVLPYMCFMYFIVFSLAEPVLDLFAPRPAFVVRPGRVTMTGFQNALNGVGTIFGGSADRTPLPLQMSGSLIINLLAPAYKMWLYGHSLRKLPWSRSYAIAALLYVVSFVLLIVDKASKTSSSINGFCILFFIGAWFGCTYNVHQEQLMDDGPPMASLTFVESLRLSVHVLRPQLTWLFIFSWLAALLALIPGFDQATLTSDSFLQSWGLFLPFGNVYMNLFNLGYVVCFVTGIFMNKFDSAFNMITSNISAVTVLWTGWVPSIAMQTVGFVPSVPLTVVAMLLSAVAVVPAYRYSIELKAVMSEVGTPRQRLLRGDHSSPPTPLLGLPAAGADVAV